MPSYWLFSPFVILMRLPISTSYAGGLAPLSDADLDQIGAAGEVAPLRPQTESELSGQELEAVDGQGRGPLSLGWPLVVGYNEGLGLPPVENPVSLLPRFPSIIRQSNSGSGSVATPYAHSR